MKSSELTEDGVYKLTQKGDSDVKFIVMIGGKAPFLEIMTFMNTRTKDQTSNTNLMYANYDWVKVKI